MAVQFGDSGNNVSEVQKYLSLLGYDLIIDNKFGKVTLRSVKAFQKKVGLYPTGIVGDMTIVALKAAQKRSSKEGGEEPILIDYPAGLNIITTHCLPPEQYIKQLTDKKQIYIHFTAGGPNAQGTISYWDQDEPRVATAFVIDGDTGAIYQAFHPDYWSFHLGVKGTNGKLDKASIGIEICAFGPLKEKDGEYFAWPNNFTRKVSAEHVIKLDKPFRDFLYYYKYSDAQLENLEKLLDFLIDKYSIEIQGSFDETWYDYKADMLKNVIPGIWTHVNVRKDKSDSYPDPKLLPILNKLAKKYKQ